MVVRILKSGVLSSLGSRWVRCVWLVVWEGPVGTRARPPLPDVEIEEGDATGAQETISGWTYIRKAETSVFLDHLDSTAHHLIVANPLLPSRIRGPN